MADKYVIVKGVEEAAEGVKQDLRPLIKEYTFALEEELVRRIQDGPKTGRTYRRGTRTHRASRAGESPAADYGVLAASIKARFPSEYAGEVFIGASYADILESEMNRPFVVPAVEAVIARKL